MSLGRVLCEHFQPDVLDWLRERVELVVVDPWVDPAGWEREAPGVEAVISRKGRISRELIEKSGGRLKLIARTGVGVDPSRVDLDAAKQYRVWVTNQPGSNSIAVAELVMGQMIALVRHMPAADRAVKSGRWSDYMQFFGTELAGKTLGIIGMGNVGTRVALRARAFEMQLLVYDPYIPSAPITSLGGSYVGLDELLTRADFVTVHCPMTAETKGMIGERELGLMQPTTYVINAARGGIVDEEALFAALSAHQIAGAALDVVEEEPPQSEHPLFTLPNVLWTPHLGAGTAEATTRSEWGAAQECIRVLEGGRPRNPVIELE